jgi:hypothetical protein
VYAFLLLLLIGLFGVLNHYMFYVFDYAGLPGIIFVYGCYCLLLFVYFIRILPQQRG